MPAKSKVAFIACAAVIATSSFASSAPNNSLPGIFRFAKPPTSQDAAYYRGAGAALSGDYAGAVKLLTPLAQTGDSRAAFLLSKLYATGRGNFPPDPEQSKKWLRLAAQQGHVTAKTMVAAEEGDSAAQTKVGAMYLAGNDVSVNYEEAAKWFRLAADQGDLTAETRLGTLYVTGKGVPASYEEAAKWFRRAAEEGQSEAQQNLGFLYLTGQGVQTNVVYALMWYNVASQPDKRSDEIRRRLAEELPDDQRSRAQELADACAKANFKGCATEPGTEFAVRSASTTPEVVLFNGTTVNSYPPISIRLQEQGTVGIKYRIGVNGVVVDCLVTFSSGKSRLDDAACANFAKNWVFLPAIQDGMAVETEKTFNVVFQLK